MQNTLPLHNIVLLGAGHTNSHVLRMWRMQPRPDARLICVSNSPLATYSGMLPGVLAGQYPDERMQIDLVRLCASVGARLVVGEVTGLDVAHRRLQLADRPPLPFDLLSIGIGSVPNIEGVEITGDALMPVKPMQTLLPRLESRLREAAARLATEAPRRLLRVAVVGGGAGGLEITFCLPARVRQMLENLPLKQVLIDGHETLLPDWNEGARRRVLAELGRREVELVLGRRVVKVEENTLTLDDGGTIMADVVLWTAAAAPPALLERFPLPKDEKGFLLTRPTLQTTADEPIFAVGDSGTIEGDTRPKAGVFAVRQGPILWENLSRLLAGETLRPYAAQRGFLKLLNTGDGRAIGQYKRFSFQGGWVWKLKDGIDSRFIEKYRDYRPPEMQMAAAAGPPAMRCAGCGGKVAGTVLSRVLARLDLPPSEHVIVGLEAADDAAVIRPPAGHAVTLTTDFFAAPLDDPLTVGRIAALNSASDLLAMGARPLAALAMITLPVGPAARQEELLYEVLAGSLREFRAMGATIAGGHTIEGERLTVGFTVLGDQSQSTRTKNLLRAGDALVLTKPLGSGVLLAAHMQARCRAEWYGPLVDTMLASNAPVAELFESHDIQGVTDITGFGLAGHLLEMLTASQLSAEIKLEEIPLMGGAGELLEQGLQSTLAPANRAAERAIEVSGGSRHLARYAALFDPQTSGGLLLGVPGDRVEQLLEHLHQGAAPAAVLVGHATAADENGPRIHLR